MNLDINLKLTSNGIFNYNLLQNAPMIPRKTTKRKHSISSDESNTRNVRTKLDLSLSTTNNLTNNLSSKSFEKLDFLKSFQSEYENTELLYSLNPPKKNSNKPSQEVMSWEKKRPELINGVININGESYRCKNIGEGKEYYVYELEGNVPIKIINETVSANKVALKIIHPLQEGGRHMGIHTKTKSAYSELIKGKIPIAKVYASPTDFIDSHSEKNGGFWLVEKCATKITGESWKNNKKFEELSPKDQEILSWVKKQLTITAETKTQTVNDLRRDNVMLDDEGSIKVVDYTVFETKKWDIMFQLKAYVKDWSCGNVNIFNYLTEKFPEKVKMAALETFNEKKETLQIKVLNIRV